MTTPPFILRLRELVGTQPLWLSSVSTVTVRGDEVLVIRRADNGRWGPVAGIIEPGEHPAETAVREIAEEAGIEARVERIAGVDVSEEVEYANGDRTQYLVIVVRCAWAAGNPHPVDGEALEARWVRIDALDELDPPISESGRRHIDWALREEPGAVFRPVGSGTGTW